MYDIEKLKSIPLYDLVSPHVKLKKTGNNYIGLCPFHNEKSPSFNIQIKENYYKCFGCGASGDSIDFYAHMKNIDNAEAIKEMGEIYGAGGDNWKFQAPSGNATPRSEDSANLRAPIIPPGQPVSGKALDWFGTRKISAATVNKLGITLGTEWMPGPNKEVPVIQFRYFHNKECFNIKFRGPNKSFKLVKEARLGFYNTDNVSGKEVWIVEGEMDAAAMTEAGIASVISVSNGSQSIGYITEYAALFAGKHVYIAGDGDEAGKKLSADLMSHFGPDRSTLVTWPATVKDANEYLIQHSPLELFLFADSYRIKQPDAAPEFPIQIFPQSVQDNFREIATERSIPLDLICTAALFSVTALSGNMYETELNGAIKNIMYALLVAPSGVGKSPAYNVVCGDIIAPAETAMHKEYELKRNEYKAAKMASKSGDPGVDPPPPLKPRMIKGGTMEGIMRHAMHAAAGFGIYYDEGGRMMSGPGAYKQNNSSLDFWNELWDGKPYFDVRADEDRERFVPETSISVLAGMQTSRIGNHFTVDGIESGIAGRFIIASSPDIQLNEEVDHFAKDKRRACDEWRELILFLFKAGMGYDPRYKRTIMFTDEAHEAYNLYSSQRIKESNKRRITASKDDVSAIMKAYDSKLYSYQGRFLIPCAILQKVTNPVITIDTVNNSKLLYDYYRHQALTIFKGLTNSQASGLSENQQLLYDALPNKFGIKEANEIAKGLRLSNKFFIMAFKRVYDKGNWISKNSKGEYVKD